jgi:hypothetical protein
MLYDLTFLLYIARKLTHTHTHTHKYISSDIEPRSAHISPAQQGRCKANSHKLRLGNINSRLGPHLTLPQEKMPVFTSLCIQIFFFGVKYRSFGNHSTAIVFFITE